VRAAHRAFVDAAPAGRGKTAGWLSAVLGVAGVTGTASLEAALLEQGGGSGERAAGEGGLSLVPRRWASSRGGSGRGGPVGRGLGLCGGGGRVEVWAQGGGGGEEGMGGGGSWVVEV